MIIIRHTHEEGTILHGSTKGGVPGEPGWQPRACGMSWGENAPPEQENRWLRVRTRTTPEWHLNHGAHFISLLNVGDRARPGRRWSYTLYRLYGEHGIANLGSGHGDDRDKVIAEALAALCRRPGVELDPAVVEPLVMG